MRNWTKAERVLRQEAGLNVGKLGEHPLPLVIAVGGKRPEAVIALGGLDPSDPVAAITEVAMLARAFCPVVPW